MDVLLIKEYSNACAHLQAAIESIHRLIDAANVERSGALECDSVSILESGTLSTAEVLEYWKSHKSHEYLQIATESVRMALDNIREKYPEVDKLDLDVESDGATIFGTVDSAKT